MNCTIRSVTSDPDYIILIPRAICFLTAKDLFSKILVLNIAKNKQQTGINKRPDLCYLCYGLRLLYVGDSKLN